MKTPVARSARVAAFLAAVTLSLTMLGVSSAYARLAPGSPNTISGTVLDASSAPIPGVHAVLLARDGSGYWHVVSGLSDNMSVADGSYVFENVPAGQYRVVFEDVDVQLGWTTIWRHIPRVYNGHELSPGDYFMLFTDHPSVPVDLVTVPASGHGPTGVNCALALEPVSISGRVRDTGGNPIGNVSARLFAEGGQSLFAVPVKADGTYAFRGLFPGRYRVGFSDESSGTWNGQYYGATQAFGSATSIECSGVAPYSAVTEQPNVDATLTPASQSVTGTVTDALTGAPLSGIALTAASADTSASFPSHAVHANTAEDGTYVLRGLISGRTYTVRATDPAGRHARFALGSVAFAGVVLRADARMSPVPVLEAFNADPNLSVGFQLFAKHYGQNYTDMTDVVLTSADTGRIGETLNAPGLCWAYQVTKPESANLGKNAPLVTVPSAGTPGEANLLIAEIGQNNRTSDHHVTVHVVATRQGISDAQLSKIRTYAQSAGVTVIVDRLVSKTSANKYDLAEAAIRRVKARCAVNATDAISWSGIAFVVNGADNSKSYAPLSSAAIGAARGAVLLPVSSKSVPKQTARVAKALRLLRKNMWAVGDRDSISDKVRKQLGVYASNRLQGPAKGANRYTFAVAVARLAVTKHWLTNTGVIAIATTPQDALKAAAVVGDEGGPLLLESYHGGTRSETKVWVKAWGPRLSNLWFVGDGASDHMWDYGRLFIF